MDSGLAKETSEFKFLRLSAEQFALGMYWAWLWSFFQSSNLFNSVGVSSTETILSCRLIALGAMVVCLLLGALFSNVSLLPAARRILFFIVLVLGPTSVLCIYLSQTVFVLSISSVLFGIVGAALAFLWTAYIMQFGNEDTSHHAYCIFLSIVVGALLYFLIQFTIAPIPFIIIALLPFLAGLIFMRSKDLFCESSQAALRIDNNLSEIPSDKNKKTPSIIVSIFFGLFIYGAAFGALRGVDGFYGNDMSNFLSFSLLILIGGFFAVYFLNDRHHGLSLIYRVVMPCVVCGFLLLPLFETSFSVVARAVVGTGCIIFEALMWIVLFDVIGRFQLPTLRMFGIGRAMTALGIALGQLVLNYTVISAGLTEPSQSILLIMAVIVTVALIFVATFLINEKKIEASQSKNLFESEGPADAYAGMTPEEILDEKCKMVIRHYLLTEREGEILVLLVNKKTARDIEQALTISNHTVKAHTYNIYRKLDIHSRAEAINLVKNVR